MSTCPWQQRLAQSYTDEQIAQLVDIRPRLNIRLGDLPAEDAAAQLKQAMKALFVSTGQTCDLLRQLQSRARAYTLERYPDERAFLRCAYASAAEHAEYEPSINVTALLGLPGTSKSQVTRAFSRLFPPSPVEVTGHTGFITRPDWRMTVRSGDTLRRMVTSHFRRDESESGQLPTFFRIQREVAQQGVALLLADELQFLTQGSTHTAVAKLLLQLSLLGPPLVYSANYSLIHRLMKRPQEEKDRLLADLLFLHPDSEESADWATYIHALFSLDMAFEKLDLHQAGTQIHRYTFGMRRCTVNLLVGAYRCMRARLGEYVEGGDLQRAYQSQAYASSRTDVEILFSGLEKQARRKDLWCPLEGHGHRGHDATTSASATTNELERATEVALLSSLTPEQRQHLARPSVPAPVTPRPPPKRSQADIADLTRGYEVLEEKLR